MRQPHADVHYTLVWVSVIGADCSRHNQYEGIADTIV
jgi:hypothetical protein